MRYNRKCKMAYLLGFNNNIRCIEMEPKKDPNKKGGKFNNNIRCIEMRSVADLQKAGLSLITT